MEETPQLLKGLNYGSYSFDKNNFIISKDGKHLLNVPLTKITNSSVFNKQDVALELQPDGQEGEDMCVELRMYIPPFPEKKTEKKKKKAENDKIDEENGDIDEEKNGEERNSAEVLNNLIMKKANISEGTGEVIVSFTDLQFIVPRGKYSCDLSANSLRMHGPTFNHIIQYKNISKAFLLPKPDDMHMVFVLGLDKPLRQGKTTYHYLVMQLRKDTDEEVEIKLPQEKISQLYGEKLKQKYEGELHDIIAKVFKAIIKINIIIPGDFKSSTNQSGIKCSNKAREGHLYFLIKSLIFVPKPLIYIKHEEIKSVEFFRLGTSGQMRMFDLTVSLKDGQFSNFSGIDKKELELIMEYFQARKIPVRTMTDASNLIIDDDDESDDNDRDEDEDDEADEEDEDFIARDDEEDDDDDDDDELVEEDESEDERPTRSPKKYK